MPLKFLQMLKKAKHDNIKKRSKSTADLSQANPDLLISTANNNNAKIKKSKWSLFSKKKRSNNSGIKDTIKNKENEVKNSDETKAKKDCQEKDDNQTIDQPQDCTAENTPTRQPTRSASCGTFLNDGHHEKRLSDLAQLQHYIDYHERHASEHGNNTTRLLCAQMLRQSMQNIEQIRDKPDMTRSMSNLSFLSSANSNHHFQKHKTIQSRRSSQWNSAQHESRTSSTDSDKRRSWVSNTSDTDKDEDGPIKFVCGSTSDLSRPESTIEEYDAINDHVDKIKVRDLFKKPKAMSKRRSVPVFSSDIEIY